MIFDILSYSPALFANIISKGRWELPLHIAYLDRELIKLTKREFNNLIINMPPRHGKSEFVSKYFPAWYLLNNPDHRIILTSYESTFATSWGRKVRDLIEQYGYLYGVQLNPVSKSVQQFDLLNHEGGMTCVGAGGAITGKGANLLIIDDPVKNMEEAFSETVRENIWQWYISTALTRIEPDGIQVLIMTKWHIDDLCGRIMKDKDFEDYRKIIIPAIASRDDVLGRPEGTALWSKRYDIDKLNEIKSKVKNFWFNALYNQEPSERVESLIDVNDFRYYFNTPEGMIRKTDKVLIQDKDVVRYATVDLAVSLSDRADYTVVLSFAVDNNNNIYISDIFRKRMKGIEHLETIKRIYIENRLYAVGVESVQYQSVLVEGLAKEGVVAYGIEPHKDKLTRCYPILSFLCQNKIYLPEGASWLSDFLNELSYFPNGTHDDQVDCFAYIHNFIRVKNSEPVSSKIDIFRNSIAMGF